jgi:phosphotransferase system  glucose/maltose/N-acetylglucosamine-specific IIC component
MDTLICFEIATLRANLGSNYTGDRRNQATFSRGSHRLSQVEPETRFLMTYFNKIRSFTLIAVAGLGLAMVAAAPKADAQVSVGIGVGG